MGRLRLTLGPDGLISANPKPHVNNYNNNSYKMSSLRQNVMCDTADSGFGEDCDEFWDRFNSFVIRDEKEIEGIEVVKKKAAVRDATVVVKGKPKDQRGGNNNNNNSNTRKDSEDSDSNNADEAAEYNDFWSNFHTYVVNSDK